MPTSHQQSNTRHTSTQQPNNTAHTNHSKWGFGIKYMTMYMDGNRKGSESLNKQEIYDGGYSIAPLTMRTQMWMFHVMYILTSNIHLMLMAPYIRKSMQHRNRMGRVFTTRSDGLGDISLLGKFLILHTALQQLFVSAGFGLPTGSINARDETPAGPDQLLPYPMQLGSGTVNLMVNFMYFIHFGFWQWILFQHTFIPLGKNYHHYAVGNAFLFGLTLQRQIISCLALSATLQQSFVGNYRGADRGLNRTTVPTADPSKRGGRTLSALAGIHFTPTQGSFKGQSLELVFGAPIYQNLDGPQLETNWQGLLEWKIHF